MSLPSDLASLLPDLEHLARLAGQTIMEVYESDFAVKTKSDASPVTEADERAEAVILPGLARLTPGIPMVAEEQVAAGRIPDIGSGPFWLIDPLDGTKEFVAGRTEYTVNIALIARGVPVLGIVGAPALDRLWRGIVASPHADWTTRAERLALAPNGAVQSVERIHARPRPASTCVAAISRSHPDAKTSAFIAALGNAVPLEAGSALKFCWVAEGRADIYPRLAQTSEWDVAAGAALVAAAGGRVEDGEGGTLLFGRHTAQFRVPGFIAEGAPAA